MHEIIFYTKILIITSDDKEMFSRNNIAVVRNVSIQQVNV